MTDAIRLTPMQLEHMDRIKGVAQPFYNNPQLLGDSNSVEELRKEIDAAVEAGLPEAAYVEIQIIVSFYDNQIALPEHLRDFNFGI